MDETGRMSLKIVYKNSTTRKKNQIISYGAMKHRTVLHFVLHSAVKHVEKCNSDTILGKSIQASSPVFMRVCGI